MSLADNLTAIQAILQGVEGVANVYDTVRNWQSEKEFLDGAKTPGDTIQFWFLAREATSAKDLGPQFTSRTHTVVIHGYLGVKDAAASEKMFQAVVEEVCSALNADRKLDSTARHSQPAQVRRVDFRVLMNVLLHHAELALAVEDKPA